MAGRLIRAAELAAYSPANHTGTSNVRVVGPETVGATALEVLVGTIVRSHGAKPHAHPSLEQCAYMIEGTGESEAEGRVEVMGPGTWTYVTPATVGEQLLYEIGDPARYLLPDVVCDFRQVRMEQAGPHARSLPTREVVLRLTVTHADRRALEMFSREFAAPGTSWSPGTTGASGRPSVSPGLRQFAWLIPKEQVTPAVTLGETTFTVALPPPRPQVAAEPVAPSERTLPAGPRKIVPLVQIAFGRSGDKGDTSNIGLIARHRALLPVLLDQVMAVINVAFVEVWIALAVEMRRLPPGDSGIILRK